MHDLDVVAGTVEQLVGIALILGQVRRDQREVGIVQTP